MIRPLNAPQLKELMDGPNPPVLVDCREPGEYRQGHIKGAKPLPLSEFEQAPPQLDKTRKIVLQCRSGKRSLKAAQYLAGREFPHLYNLEGGILAWQNEGFPIEV